jgi:prepilin-type N-terminal cleavage/methylation domain-containing protein
MRAWRERRTSNDDGLTLVELLVSTLIFAIILTIITASIITMLEQERKQTSQTNNLDAARNVIEMLDHQVRYANAVSTPGTGTDGSFYVEFRTGNSNLQQTCTQWRYVPVGGAMQYRTWQPPLGGVGSATPTGWATAGTGFSQVVVGATTVPIFSLSQSLLSQPSAQVTAQGLANTHYQLAVAFNASNGSPPVSSESDVTITAINSSRIPTSPTPPSVCTENGRP